MNERQRIREEVPASFLEAASGHYLGDPEVVAALVGTFCANVELAIDQFRNGELSKVLMDSMLRSLVIGSADSFSGLNENYDIINGYNDVTLAIKLRADLGEFWDSNRAAWNDNAVCVLFERLALDVAHAMKTSPLPEDDFMREIILKPTVQFVVRELLGIEERAKP